MFNVMVGHQHTPKSYTTRDGAEVGHIDSVCASSMWEHQWDDIFPKDVVGVFNGKHRARWERAAELYGNNEVYFVFECDTPDMQIYAAKCRNPETFDMVRFAEMFAIAERELG